MSVNTAHANGGVLIHSGEFILLYSQSISVEFYGQNDVLFRRTKPGRIYLTSHRLIFVSKIASEPLQSFSAPFIAISKFEYFVEATYNDFIRTRVRAQPNGNFEGEVEMKLMFKYGEMEDFAKALAKAGSITLKESNNTCELPSVLPAYEPTRAWYDAPLSAYKRPEHYYDWLPKNKLFTRPPPNSVFVCDNCAPFPGITEVTMNHIRNVPCGEFAFGLESYVPQPTNPAFLKVRDSLYTLKTTRSLLDSKDEGNLFKSLKTSVEIANEKLKQDRKVSKVPPLEPGEKQKYEEDKKDAKVLTLIENRMERGDNYSVGDHISLRLKEKLATPTVPNPSEDIDDGGDSRPPSIIVPNYLLQKLHSENDDSTSVRSSSSSSSFSLKLTGGPLCHTSVLEGCTPLFDPPMPSPIIKAGSRDRIVKTTDLTTASVAMIRQRSKISRRPPQSDIRLVSENEPRAGKSFVKKPISPKASVEDELQVAAVTNPAPRNPPEVPLMPIDVLITDEGETPQCTANTTSTSSGQTTPPLSSSLSPSISQQATSPGNRATNTLIDASDTRQAIEQSSPTHDTDESRPYPDWA